MTSKVIANGILRALGYITVVIITLLIIYKIQSVIIYLIVAILLALIINPIVEFFKRKLKFSNTLAVVLTMMLVISVFTGLIMMFIPLITSQSKNLSLLDTKSIEKNILLIATHIKEYLAQHNVEINDLLSQSNITSALNFTVIPTFLNTILNAISSFGIGLASTLFITFFVLKDKVLFITGIKSILPNNHEEKIINSFYKINEMLRKYFTGLIIQLFIVFILYLIVLLIFGVENAFIIAFLCAILNVIPYIGPLIGSILAAILTMMGYMGSSFQHIVLPNTLYVMIGFWIVQLIDNNVSQPIIFSKSVNSHPLEIFLITLASGFLFGITGMIVAIPFYTMIKIIAKEFLPNNKIIKTITKNI